MQGIDAFDVVRSTHALLPYICDDVFYGVIVKMLATEHCRRCRRWVRRDAKVNACYFRDFALCFYKCAN